MAERQGSIQAQEGAAGQQVAVHDHGNVHVIPGEVREIIDGIEASFNGSNSRVDRAVPRETWVEMMNA